VAVTAGNDGFNDKNGSGHCDLLPRSSSRNFAMMSSRISSDPLVNSS